MPYADAKPVQPVLLLHGLIIVSTNNLESLGMMFKNVALAGVRFQIILLFIFDSCYFYISTDIGC